MIPYILFSETGYLLLEITVMVAMGVAFVLSLLIAGVLLWVFVRRLDRQAKRDTLMLPSMRARREQRRNHR